MEFGDVENRNKHWAPREMLVNGSQFATALACLSDNEHLRIRSMENQLEISDDNDAAIVFNVAAVDAPTNSAVTSKKVCSVRIPSEVIETLSRASVAFPTFVRINLSKKDLKIFEPTVAGKTLLSVTLADRVLASMEAIVPSIFLRRAWDFFRRTKPEQINLSTTRDGRIMLESKLWTFISLTVMTQKGYRDGLNLGSENIPPEFRTLPIVQLIRFIGARAQGVDLLTISQVGLDIADGSNLRQIQGLGLATVKGRVVRLSDQGRNLVNLLKSSDQGPAKAFVHDLASKNLRIYRTILSWIGDFPISFEKLLSRVAERSSNQTEEARNTALIMLGLASWCGVIERKAGLFYVLAEKARANGNGESFKEERSVALTVQRYP